MCTLPCPFAYPGQQACGPCPSGARAERLNAQARQGAPGPAGAIDARQGSDGPGSSGAALAGLPQRAGGALGAKSSFGAAAVAAIVAIPGPSLGAAACESGPLAQYLGAAFLIGILVLVLGGAFHWACHMVSAFKRERRAQRAERAITKP